MHKPHGGHASRVGVLFLTLLMSTTAVAVDAVPAGATLDPALSDSEVMPRASRSLLLDLASQGAGYVTVGERGHVLLSSDGAQWRQVVVPTRSTLTAVAASGKQVWAAGHEGIILHSQDGGETWDRRRVSLQAGVSDDPSDGAPLLDVLALNDKTVMAVGAYSLMLVSQDGGLTWKRRRALNIAASTPEPTEHALDDWSFSDHDLVLDAETDPHFNAITRSGSGALVIAGERGAFLRSRTEGVRWEFKPLPYSGSMFGVLAWDGDHILVFGLRGNVLESTDLGETWVRHETGITDTLMGGAALPDGGAILVGANGAVLYRSSGKSPFTATVFQTVAGETPSLAAVLPLSENRFLLVGDKGVDLYRLGAQIEQ